MRASGLCCTQSTSNRLQQVTILFHSDKSNALIVYENVCSSVKVKYGAGTVSDPNSAIPMPWHNWVSKDGDEISLVGIPSLIPEIFRRALPYSACGLAGCRQTSEIRPPIAIGPYREPCSPRQRVDVAGSEYIAARRQATPVAIRNGGAWITAR